MEKELKETRNNVHAIKTLNEVIENVGKDVRDLSGFVTDFADEELKPLVRLTALYRIKETLEDLEINVGRFRAEYEHMAGRILC